MSLSLTRVPLLSPGDDVTSDQLATIADAFNSRLRPNVGDVVERIIYYMWSMFRYLSIDGAEAEFFQAFQMLKATDGYTWPVNSPDTSGGARTASLFGAFVLGNATLGLDSEADRISDPLSDGVPLFIGGFPPTTVQNYWDIGKAQRGAIDLSTGAIASPAHAASLSHYRIRPGPNSHDGNSWGGYMPAPTIVGTCTDALGNQFPSYQYKFTRIADSHVVTYPGSCPGVAGDVAGISTTPREYLVFVYSQPAPDIYPLNEWVQGPYVGGGVVKKQPGDHLPRVLNAFCGDFRGTDSELSQQVTDDTWLQHAFDIQRFLVSQYFLAPARGTDNHDDTVTEIYPTGTHALGTGVTMLPVGTIIQIASADTYAIHSGFVLGAILITTSRLFDSCDIQILNDGVIVHTVTLTPDGSGNAPAIQTFEAAPKGAISVRLGTNANFYNDSGSISVELAELWDYKPQNSDLALCLRLFSCRTALVSGLDGSGRDESTSNLLSDLYFANGCIGNSHDDPGPAGSATGEINTNAVFDAARRLSQCVRAIPRAQFIGYEVSGGKSICYFNRIRTISGVEIDLFEGIAPPRAAITTGHILAGVTYIVRTNTVTYNGVTVSVDATFIGVTGQAEFTGSGNVYEYEGIRSSARKAGGLVDPYTFGGFSNEWVTSAWLKGLSEEAPGDTQWSASGYTDFYWMSDRCNFYHLPAPSGFPATLQQHFDYGSAISFAPESMTGWRYAKNSNRWDCDPGDTACEGRRRDRFKSCRIYEPAPEIESATVLIEGGVEVVKLVYKTRFHHHADAPATIARSRAGWDVTALRTESTGYRTFENALREYLVWTDDGTDCVGSGDDGLPTGQGNAAFNSTIGAQPDKPMGSCFPDFYFLKLFPKPYDDGNDSQDADDTSLWADWWRTGELYIRAMCEGFVDGLTSTTIGCATGQNSIYCYTMQSLCFEAFGGAWFNTLAKSETDWLGPEAVRTDNPQGYGQLPQCSLSSEDYNQYAAALNLMNRVQIMLPMQFLVRYTTGQADAHVAATWSNDPPHTCSSSGVLSPAYYTGAPTDAAATSVGSWTEDTVLSSSVSAGIVCAACSGDDWILRSERTNGEWQWKLTNPDAIYAVPEDLRALVFDGSGAMLQSGRVLAIVDTILRKKEVSRVDTEGGASSCGNDCGGSHDAPCTDYWHDTSVDKWLLFTDIALMNTSECVVLSPSGSITTPALGESDFAIGRNPGSSGENCCNFSVQSGRSITPTLGDDTAFVEIPFA